MISELSSVKLLSGYNAPSKIYFPPTLRDLTPNSIILGSPVTSMI